MPGLVHFLIQVASYGLNFRAPHLIRTSGISNPATPALYAIGIPTILCAVPVMKALPAAAMSAARQRQGRGIR